jgi:hypothetical protein
LRLEILHIAGPVPVRRHGVIEVAALPPDARKDVERAVEAMRASKAERGAATAPIPDVGSSTITIVDDDGTSTRLTFSDAEATPDQAKLLKALRPFLKIMPWK